MAPVIPEWLQTALLTVLLAYVASKTLAKGQKQFQQERSSAQTAPQQPAVQCVLSSLCGRVLQSIPPLHRGLHDAITSCTAMHVDNGQVLPAAVVTMCTTL